MSKIQKHSTNLVHILKVNKLNGINNNNTKGGKRTLFTKVRVPTLFPGQISGPWNSVWSTLAYSTSLKHPMEILPSPAACRIPCWQLFYLSTMVFWYSDFIMGIKYQWSRYSEMSHFSFSPGLWKPACTHQPPPPPGHTTFHLIEITSAQLTKQLCFRITSRQPQLSGLTAFPSCMLDSLSTKFVAGRVKMLIAFKNHCHLLLQLAMLLNFISPRLRTWASDSC